jgi:DNA-binding Xre family transcriptional regulator
VSPWNDVDKTANHGIGRSKEVIVLAHTDTDTDTEAEYDDWRETVIFSANLNRVMTLQGMDNQWLGTMTGVSRERVRQWRNGRVYPQDLIERIAVALNCTSDDLHKPLFCANLDWLMKEKKIEANTLANLLGIAPGTITRLLRGTLEPSERHITDLCRVLDCTEDDLIRFPDLLPLSRWAAREGIPLKRARDLFDLNLLTGAIITPFSLMIPAHIKAPLNSKQLVLTQKRRPQWGMAGSRNFHLRLNRMMDRARVTDEQLANALGVAVITVKYHWRTGDRTPEEEKLPLIAQVCQCSVQDLLNHEEALAA